MGRRHPNNNRLYIGNLPSHHDSATIQKKLQEMIVQEINCAQQQVQVDVQRNHAFVTGPVDPEHLRGRLRWDDGTVITVELAKAPVPKQQHNKRNNHHKGNNNNPFGHGWSKPQKSRAPPEEHPSRMALTSNEAEDMIAAGLQEANNGVTDPLTNLLASTAAVTMALSSVDLVDDSKGSDHGDDPMEETTIRLDDGTIPSSHSPPNQSLAALLADYGEQDTEWQLKQPTNTATTTPAPNRTAITPAPESLLGQLGRAPIHIVVTSFGYRHGVPPGCCIDIRPDLEAIPHGLSWMDGTSRAVKGMLLRADARSVAQTVAQRAVDDVLAPAAAVHGYASPATLHVYVGSNHGRHRSVVVAELAGTVLRKRLRVRNVPDALRCPVSIACHHRDMHKPMPTTLSSKKRRDDEDEDEQI